MYRNVNEQSGFTLVEMLVVIGIATVLLGIIVPAGKSLREGNHAMGCLAQLQHINVGLKAYAMDEQGFPPLAVEVDGSGVPAADQDLITTTHPGLMALWELEYLQDPDTFHCPRDVEVQKTSDPYCTQEYYQSYANEDPDAKADVDVNHYRYMPHRWISDTTDENYRRQLDPVPHPDPDNASRVIVGPNSGLMPADTTVVTWCSKHVNSYTRDNEGQYLVLFWSGNATLMDGKYFVDGTFEPAAAWQVLPNQPDL